MGLYEKIQETAAFISSKVPTGARVGIILGSGLSGLTNDIEKVASLKYTEIPHFPVSTVQGHGGEMIFGKMAGKDVILMSGRFHYYEGYDMQAVTFPVRVMKALGVEILIVSNAAGGMNKNFVIGDLMLINDHINQFPEHPLRGPNDERLGTRFPDMGQPYDKELAAIGKIVAAENGISIQEGVYIGLQGPTFETPAEYRWLHVIGGDAVGMSTVPEVIVARHGGMRVFAMSVITDIGISDVPVTITHEEVLEAAAEAAPKMATIVKGIVARVG